MSDQPPAAHARPRPPAGRRSLPRVVGAAAIVVTLVAAVAGVIVVVG